MNALLQTFPFEGTVEWIGIRSQRNYDLNIVDKVEAIFDKGLSGDHYQGKSGNRQVTLIQYEHISAVASFMGIEKLDPGLLRRNM